MSLPAIKVVPVEPAPIEPGEYCWLPITHGRQIMVPAQDYQRLSAYSWRTVKVGRIQKEYVCRNVNTPSGTVTLYLAREILNVELTAAEAASGKCEVHHLNGQSLLDNRLENLLIMTEGDHHALTGQENRRRLLLAPPKPGRFKGVHASTCGRYYSVYSPMASGGSRYVASVRDPVAGALLRDRIAVEQLGFGNVYLNFPDLLPAHLREPAC
jgi:hypothetical protein